MSEKLAELKKSGGANPIDNMVTSGYLNYTGTEIALPWTSPSGRGVGVMIGVQNATELTLNHNYYVTLYKIKADGTVDVETYNNAGSKTYDVTDYEIVSLFSVNSANFTTTISII